MKKSRKLVIAMGLLSLIGLAPMAQAGIYRSCSGFNIGSVHFRSCQARFRPGWGPWGGPRFGPGRRFWRRPVVRRCVVRITPWGRVRRCTVFRR